MKLDLLWWKHRRPSVHVAEPDILADMRIIDMDPFIAELDPNDSFFTTLLMGRSKTITTPIPLYPGSHYMILERGEKDRGVFVVESCRRKNPDDWFAPVEYESVLRRPYDKRAFSSARVEWLEDQLYPRVA